MVLIPIGVLLAAGLAIAFIMWPGAIPHPAPPEPSAMAAPLPIPTHNERVTETRPPESRMVIAECLS